MNKRNGRDVVLFFFLFNYNFEVYAFWLHVNKIMLAKNIQFYKDQNKLKSKYTDIAHHHGEPILKELIKDLSLM